MIDYILTLNLALGPYFFTGVLCPEARMWNVSNEEWNQEDKKVFLQTKKQCHLYHPKEPCVKLFRKYERSMYSVICGTDKPGEVEKDYSHLPKESEIKWK